MCGIVGYVGEQSATGIILDGLGKLEYRGYDSAGIAVSSNNSILVEKKQGRLKALADHLENNSLEGQIAIGHTRWATHGEPSDNNSHPHYNKDKSIAVVHNGIIENYMELKKFLIEKGYEFLSETDTEVLPHLLDYYACDDFFKTVQRVLSKVRGSYALGILHTKYPDTIFCARKDSPLIIGQGNGENFIASDVPALLKYTKDVYFLDNEEIGIITKNSIEIFDLQGNKSDKELHRITWSMDQATKAGYPHFMLKEIFEQPKSIKDTLSRRISDKGEVLFDDINLENIDSIKNIYIVACGTAYNAGLQGKFALQKIAKLKAEVDIASEFRYSDPFVDESSLVILVSQSGETLDTLAALRDSKQKGAKTLAITNVIGSSIAREADHVIYTWAGPEIAVASTKAYTTQIAIFYLLSLYIAKNKKCITDSLYKEILDNLLMLPEQIESILEKSDEIKEVAKEIKESEHGFFLGRGLDYSVATEASLKMKEVSYMHTEAFASGELKHGTLALIEKDIPIIAINTQEYLFEKSISNIKEVKARGAHVISITQEKNSIINEVSDKVIFIPNTHELIAGITSIVPLQLLAYHVSVLRGLDVDKPRNLAKSVTVE